MSICSFVPNALWTLKMSWQEVRNFYHAVHSKLTNVFPQISTKLLVNKVSNSESTSYVQILNLTLQHPVPWNEVSSFLWWWFYCSWILICWPASDNNNRSLLGGLHLFSSYCEWWKTLCSRNKRIITVVYYIQASTQLLTHTLRRHQRR